MKQPVADARNIPTYMYRTAVVSASAETVVQTNEVKNHLCLNLVLWNGALDCDILMYTHLLDFEVCRKVPDCFLKW